MGGHSNLCISESEFADSQPGPSAYRNHLNGGIGSSVGHLSHTASFECGSSTPAAPSGQSVSKAYGIRSRSKRRDMADIPHTTLGLRVRNWRREVGFRRSVSKDD